MTPASTRWTRVVAVSLFAAAVTLCVPAGSRDAALAQAPASISMCAGTTTKIPLPATGGGLQTYTKPEVSVQGAAATGKFSSANGDAVVITAGASAGTATVTLKGEFPTGLNGIGPAQVRVVATWAVTVHLCAFVRGDWFLPGNGGAAAYATPLPNGSLIPTAKYKDVKGAELPCKADAQKAVDAAVAFMKSANIMAGQITVTSDKEKDAFKDFHAELSAVPGISVAALTAADRALDNLRVTAKHTPRKRFFARYTVQPAQGETVYVFAIEGFVPGAGPLSGPQVAAALIGMGTCTDPRTGGAYFETFTASLHAKFDEQAGGSTNPSYTAVAGTTVAEFTNLVCCPLPKTPTGVSVSPVPTEEPKTGGPPKTVERTPPPVDKDGTFKSLAPAAESGVQETGDVFMPPIAGAESVLVATVVDPNERGPSGVIVGIVEPNGEKKYYAKKTDQTGRIAFKVAAGAAAVLLFRHFDARGEPSNPAKCEVGNIAHLSGTGLLKNAPPTGPGLLEGDSAYQQGAKGVVRLHGRGLDPERSRILMDGSDRGVRTLAASDSSVVGQTDEGVPLGRHTFAVRSGATTTNEFPADVVTLTADPVAPSETGSLQNVTIRVEGVPPGDSAVVDIQVGGAAVLADGGGATTTVPVKAGVAQVRIRGVRPGAATLRYRLRVAIPGFWTT